MHDGGHGCVRVVLVQEVSRQADSLMARRHGGTDSTHSTSCRQRVGKDRPCRQNLPTIEWFKEALSISRRAVDAGCDNRYDTWVISQQVDEQSTAKHAVKLMKKSRILVNSTACLQSTAQRRNPYSLPLPLPLTLPPFSSPPPAILY